jgi:hypothetical protein
MLWARKQAHSPRVTTHHLIVSYTFGELILRIVSSTIQGIGGRTSEGLFKAGSKGTETRLVVALVKKQS